MTNEEAENYAIALASQAKTAARIVAYVVENEMFDGSCPNSCGSCRHPDCLKHEREWSEMQEFAKEIAERAPVPETRR